MTNQEFLQKLLTDQNLTTREEEELRAWRARVEKRLGNLSGNPRFYYAGSFGKKTIIRERFDLDIVIYWPSDHSRTLKEIFKSVGDELQKEWPTANPKTVGSVDHRFRK